MTATFRVYLITYNVGGTDPPEDFTRLLNLDSGDLPNLYAIGLQELLHNPRSLLTDAVFDDPWTNALTDCLSKYNYVRIKSVRLMGMHIAVYVRRNDLNYISNVESEITRCGLKGLWGNKGGVSVRMDIAGINVCFVNCHLAAHLKKIPNRIHDYDQIVENQTFRDVETESILDHDYVFWMGDLNFRLDDIPKAEVERRISEGNLNSLLEHDQLNKVMKEQLILVDFEEGPIRFAPTYRFDKGTDVYCTSKKQRKPGWCDRILWMVHEDSFYGFDLDIEQLSYYSIADYKISDHKPVIAEFSLTVLAYPPELPVMFEPMGTWSSSKHQTVSYTVTPEYKVNSRDWVGLYLHDYKHPHDYRTYAWSSTNGDSMGDGSWLYEVEFDSYSLREFEGTYCLAYYSYSKNCIVGYSDTFQIMAVDESSDESSSSSDEQVSARPTRHKKTTLRTKMNHS